MLRFDEAIADCERKLENARADLAAMKRRVNSEVAIAEELLQGFEHQLADLERKRTENQA